MSASHNNESSVPLVDLLGPTIILNNQDEISVAELAQRKKTVVLYFSAHWCPPCPILSKAYADHKSSRSSDDWDGPENDDSFELIFVSSDSDAEAFREYHSQMSFPALPYESRDIKAKLDEKFEIQGIPRLVALDSSTGETSSVNAAVDDPRSFIVQHGAAAFPLRPAHVQKMKDEAKKKQADAMQQLTATPIVVSAPRYSSPSIIGKTGVETLDTVDEPISEKVTIELSELLERHDYVGLVFGDGDKSDATYDELHAAGEDLAPDAFVPVYVGWSEHGDDADHAAVRERFRSVREEDLTDEVRAILGEAAGKSLDGPTMMTIQRRRERALWAGWKLRVERRAGDCLDR